MNTDIKEFKSKLSNFVVKFSFTKKDGTIREAIGTTNASLIPEQPTKETSRTYKSNPSIIKYYDIDKEGWRSFNESNFISFE